MNASMMALLELQLRELEDLQGGQADDEARELLATLKDALGRAGGGAPLSSRAEGAAARSSGAAASQGAVASAAGRAATTAPSAAAAAAATPAELARVARALGELEAQLQAVELAVSSSDGETRRVLVSALQAAGVAAAIEEEEGKQGEASDGDGGAAATAAAAAAAAAKAREDPSKGE